jgi:hypothetical protein
MSDLSSQEVTAGISRKAIASFQRNSKNGHKTTTLEDHLAGKAIGTPEKTAIVDTWNRNLDLINVSGWNFGIRETEHSHAGVRVVELFFTRPELQMLAERILKVLSDSPAKAE